MRSQAGCLVYVLHALTLCCFRLRVTRELIMCFGLWNMGAVVTIEGGFVF